MEKSFKETRKGERTSPSGAEARGPVGRAVSPQILGDGAGTFVDSDVVCPAIVRILERKPGRYFKLK